MKDIEPTEFAEKYYGVKLTAWEKAYLKLLWKYKGQLFVLRRGRKW